MTMTITRAAGAAVAAALLALGAAPSEAKNIFVPNSGYAIDESFEAQLEEDVVVEDRLNNGVIRRSLSRDGVVAVLEDGPNGEQLSFQGDRAPSWRERRAMIDALRAEDADKRDGGFWGWFFSPEDDLAEQGLRERYQDLHDQQTGRSGYEARRRANEELAEALINEHMQRGDRGWFSFD